MCIFQGPSDHTRLLHTGLAAGLLPYEAEATDSHLHLRPAQRVPGWTTVPSHRGRHQAQGAAAHLPELPPVPGVWDRTACSQPKVRWRWKCSTTHEFAELDVPTVKQNNNFLHLDSSVNHRCMKNVSLPREAQVKARADSWISLKYPEKRQESTCYFGRLQHSTLTGFWDETKRETEREAVTRLLNCRSSELLINC